MMKRRIPSSLLCLAITAMPTSRLLAEEVDVGAGRENRPIPKKEFVQPPEVAKEFEPLMTGSLKQRLEALKQKVKRDFVFIEGGTFMMGDFGRVHSEEELYYTGQRDNKPLHEVTLSSFSLSRFKVTYLEFDLYSEATGAKKIAQEFWFEKDRRPLHPAESAWREGQNYCRWLGKLLHLNIDLPTEAQWEFAARNRGEFTLFSTNNGEYEPGHNLSHYDQREAYGNSMYYPVGIFPFTPLGLYDMAENGSEWMQDWYDADYYEHSPTKDPKGPPSGHEKVIRTRPNPNDRYTGLTMWRSKDIPAPTPKLKVRGTSALRCALQSSIRIKP